MDSMLSLHFEEVWIEIRYLRIHYFVSLWGTSNAAANDYSELSRVRNLVFILCVTSTSSVLEKKFVKSCSGFYEAQRTFLPIFLIFEKKIQNI
jgi:hypothetical protein